MQEFTGGQTDVALIKAQWTYASKNFPNQAIETDAGDHNELLAYTLSQLGQLNNPVSAIAKPYTGTKAAYEKFFFLVNDFRSSDQNNLYSGINTSASRSPIQLNVTFSEEISTNVYNFVESSSLLVIDKYGQVRLTEEEAANLE